MKKAESESEIHSVMSDSFWPHWLQLARLLCPWSSPDQNTGVGSHSLFQGIRPNPRIEPRFPALQADSLPSEPLRKPKEVWGPKNWCFWTVVLEKTLESLLDCKEIKPINPKGSQPWIFNGKTDAEAEVPIFWPLDVKNQLIGKDPDAGKYWRQKEKGAAENEMVR